MENSLTDSIGRKIDYLRIAVTDRCNLRCVYCMPEGGVPLLNRREMLSYEELAGAVELLVDMGITKVRITGGEPLARRDIIKLVSRIGKIEKLEDMSLTTNGAFLSGYVKELKEAGIKRINISVDSLNPQKYKKITRGGDLKDVLDSIEACIKAGFSPIKLNTVLSGYVDKQDIEDLIKFSIDRPVVIRFIEMMEPVYDDPDYRNDPGSRSVSEYFTECCTESSMGQSTDYKDLSGLKINGAVQISANADVLAVSCQSHLFLTEQTSPAAAEKTALPTIPATYVPTITIHSTARPAAVTIVTADDIFEIMGKHGKYHRLTEQIGFGPSVYYKIEGAQGTLGFISNNIEACSVCNRIRLTPTGRLRLCLFSNMEFNLRDRLRANTPAEKIKKEINEFIKAKPQNREAGCRLQLNSRLKLNEFMNKIGG